MNRKNRKYRPVPPYPQDGAKYVLVKTKEGPYWRKKRGTVKKAELNAAFKRVAEATSLASPAAKRIYDKLLEFLKGLKTGRFIANVSAKLKRSYVRDGAMNFSLFKDYDLQPDYPISELLKGSYQVYKKDGGLTIKIKIDKNTVKRLNKLISAYYFEVILLSGDPGKTKGLRIDSAISPLYGFDEKLDTECRLSLSLPVKKIPWMAFLKLSCHEDDEPASHARHYGIKVVEVGE
jgi:hypothetical protein